MKIHTKVSITVFATIGLGLLGLLTGANYGGNGGDFGCFMEGVYGYPGYESCGASYGIMGLILGLVGAILIVSAINKSA